MPKLDYLAIEAELPPGDFSQYDIMVMLPELKKLTKEDIYLEVGVQYGRSLYLVAKYSEAKIYGVDIQPTLKRNLLRGLKYNYTDKGSDKAAWDFNKPISLLFIDGDHSFHGCGKDIYNWLPHVKSGGVILFHDCDDSSPGVVRAVKEAFGKYETFEYLGNTSMAKVTI